MTSVASAVKRQKKIARTLVRLKYSLQADEEIDRHLAQLEEVGRTGSLPQLETTLQEILSVETA